MFYVYTQLIGQSSSKLLSSFIVFKWQIKLNDNDNIGYLIPKTCICFCNYWKRLAAQISYFDMFNLCDRFELGLQCFSLLQLLTETDLYPLKN